jgi:hypothetical protein
MSKIIALKDNQELVLRHLAGMQPEVYWPFSALTYRTKLTRAQVRLACRSLRRKGLAEFRAGLWTEDGEPAGAGYSATTLGRELVGDNAIEDQPDDTVFL